jgi:hypothetical protein
MSRLAILWLGIALGGCPHAAGGYAKDDRAAGGSVDRGETNGRTFDFVSNKPEGDDWTIRVRGSSLWASYAHEEATETLGSANLSERDTRKVWNLIDRIDLPNHKKGKKDQDDGFVTMVLREPGGDDGHAIYTVNVSRTTKDEAVIDLADYLGDLIKKYYKKKGKPEF